MKAVQITSLNCADAILGHLVKPSPQERIFPFRRRFSARSLIQVHQSPDIQPALSYDGIEQYRRDKQTSLEAMIAYFTHKGPSLSKRHDAFRAALAEQ